MRKKYLNNIVKVFSLVLLFVSILSVYSFANELAQNTNSQATNTERPAISTSPQLYTIEELTRLYPEAMAQNDYFRATFHFPLQGPKSDILVKALDITPVDLEKDDDREDNQNNRRENADNRNRDGNRENRGGNNPNEEDNSDKLKSRELAFNYALKTPYYFTENEELMLDVLELVDLYEPNLKVTMKDDILTLIFTEFNKKETKKEIAIPASVLVPESDSVNAEANNDTAAEAKAPENSDASNATTPPPAPKQEFKTMLEVQFDKQEYTLVIDLNKSEDAALLSNIVYQTIVEERELNNTLPDPIAFIADEEKSTREQAVLLNAPVEIIENYVFVPLSLMTFFDEIIQKEETSIFASSKEATKDNIDKLSKIKNITKEIEKAPEFLSRENFELIYSMIGPAGTAILVLVVIATYLALKNFYYLTFVWFQFMRKYKKLDNECVMLDENLKTKNPLIHLIREIDSLKLKDPTALRVEISFIFNRNFENVVQDLSYIRLISVISPLLGLLGTVLGMVDVFQAIAESASPDPAELAAGIWSALLTTILGLSVAVPTLVVYYYLLLKYKRYQNRMIKFSKHFNEACDKSNSDSSED